MELLRHVQRNLERNHQVLILFYMLYRIPYSNINPIVFSQVALSLHLDKNHL